MCSLSQKIQIWQGSAQVALLPTYEYLYHLTLNDNNMDLPLAV